VGNICLARLDVSNEIFMDVMLTAIMDLAAEGKTMADIKYKGKNSERWFRMVFPPILSPVFLGVLTRGDVLAGYLVVTQSLTCNVRKGLGIALVQGYRGKGIVYHVFKHVQDNIDTLFGSEIHELMFETSKTNMAMIRIAHRLGFLEDNVPQGNKWGELAEDRIRFLWIQS
jgi:hypothetical protein